MDPQRLKAVRERRNETGAQFAEFLNEQTGCKYNRHKVSGWENQGAIPQEIIRIVMMQEVALGLRSHNALTVAVANQKGGVGKTVTSICLAFALTQTGHTVLLIDADSQSNATVHVGIDKSTLVSLSKEGRTLYHALLKDVDITSIIQPTANLGLDLIPSSLMLADADAELATDPMAGGIQVLRNLLPALRERYDFIIIDCAPNLGYVTMAALTAADQVLIPTQTEPHSMMGIEHLIGSTIAKIRRKPNPNLDVLGIVPTQFKPRNKQDKDSLAELHAAWGDKTRIYEPIPERTYYASAAGSGVIPLAIDPKLAGATTYRAIADDLVAMTSTTTAAAATTSPETNHG